MEPPFSTLELLKHDETARAPERDYAATAFELDASALAPQVVPDTTPQVSYDTSLPEAHSKNEDSDKTRASSDYITKAALKWPWMVVAFFVAAAIAIGVTVGIWRHHGHKPSTTINPSPPQNHTMPPAAQYILNDTSLAALSLSNGDRHLFFQDNAGLIRRVFRTSSNSQWSTSTYLNFSDSADVSDGPYPKNNTPLAVTVYEDGKIQLFYVSDGHQLSSLFAEGCDYAMQESTDNYNTANETRSLAVILLPGSSLVANGSQNSTTNLALLYYENPSGNISVLLQRSTSTGTAPRYQWFDISSQSSKSLPDGFRNNDHVTDGDHNLYETTSGHTLSNNASVFAFTPPFTSSVNSSMLYADGSLTQVFYHSGPSGPGNFRASMLYTSSSPDRLFAG